MKAIHLFKNKYLIATILFMVWMLFFDHNNIFLHLQYRKELNELKADKKYYQEQINLTRKEVDLIKSNPQAMEKVAREQYLMKKDDEDVFVVEEGQVMSDEGRVTSKE
jgi:cell division protein FtsB